MLQPRHRLWKDGAPLPLGSRKQRAALALLILEARRVVSTDRLVDAQRGDAPTSGRDVPTELRLGAAAGAGDDVLVRKTARDQLPVVPEQVDAERFRRALAEVGGTDADVRVARRAAALETWRRPPLAEIGRLEELRLVAREEAHRRRTRPRGTRSSPASSSR